MNEGNGPLLTVRDGFAPAPPEEVVALLHDAEEDDALLRDAVADPLNHVYSAWREGALVGSVVVRWRPGLTSEIRYLAVREDVRSEGIGRALLDHVKAVLPGHGPKLVVGTANSSLDNIAFYQRCGFRMSSISRDHFSYVPAGTEEFGIPLRDMVVFEFEAADRPNYGRWSSTATSDTAALEEVSFLLVPGSTRVASGNNAVLRALAELVPHAAIYGGLERLPQFNPDSVDEPGQEVENLRGALDAADVVVLCTPEYAGSLPGSLKNLLDWTVGTGHLYRKPVAWINTALPGRGGGASAALDVVLGYVDADVLEPGGFRLPLGPGSVDGGRVVDDDYRSALAEVAAGLAKEASLRRAQS